MRNINLTNTAETSQKLSTKDKFSLNIEMPKAGTLFRAALLGFFLFSANPAEARQTKFPKTRCKQAKNELTEQGIINTIKDYPASYKWYKDICGCELIKKRPSKEVDYPGLDCSKIPDQPPKPRKKGKVKNDRGTGGGGTSPNPCTPLWDKLEEADDCNEANALVKKIPGKNDVRFIERSGCFGNSQKKIYKEKCPPENTESIFYVEATEECPWKRESIPESKYDAEECECPKGTSAKKNQCQDMSGNVYVYPNRPAIKDGPDTEPPEDDDNTCDPEKEKCTPEEESNTWKWILKTLASLGSIGVLYYYFFLAEEQKRYRLPQTYKAWAASGIRENSRIAQILFGDDWEQVVKGMVSDDDIDPVQMPTIDDIEEMSEVGDYNSLRAAFLDQLELYGKLLEEAATQGVDVFNEEGEEEID